MTEEPLDVLGLDPVGVLAVHGLPGGVVEPGAAHDLQPGAGPVHGVALPLLKVHLEDPATDHDEEVPLVPDELGVGPVVSLGVPRGKVGGEFPPWRMTVIESSVRSWGVLVILLGVTEVIFITAAAVTVSAAPVIVPDIDNAGLNIPFEIWSRFDFIMNHCSALQEGSSGTEMYRIIIHPIYVSDGTLGIRANTIKGTLC